MQGSEGFPPYAVSMVRTGEQSGHLEDVLRNLEMYYDEESRMFTKLRSAVGHPAALLVIMTAILAFTVIVILPVFQHVYRNMTSSLAASSMTSVNASNIIGIVALVITAILAIGALWLVFASSTEGGRRSVISLFKNMPGIGAALYQLSLSRFTAALATYVSSGITHEEAMNRVLETVDNEALESKLRKATDSMVDLDNPRSLTQAITENDIFEPLYVRLLTVGMHSGSTEETLAKLSVTFFDDAIARIDQALDNVEPVLAAFLTIAVGATLIAVMLPLIGIMASIG